MLSKVINYKNIIDRRIAPFSKTPHNITNHLSHIVYVENHWSKGIQICKL